MSEPLDKHQWKVHAAHRPGWEGRVGYYERLLRGIMEMLQDAENLMKIDDTSDLIRSLERVMIELEDVWTLVSAWKTEELSRPAGQRLPARPWHDPNGAS
jgi:hypothetical protein